MNTLAPALEAAGFTAQAGDQPQQQQQQPTAQLHQEQGPQQQAPQYEIPATFKTTDSKGITTRIKGVLLFPFVWLAALVSQTLRGLALVSIMVTLAAFGGAVLYDVYLTPKASVTFRHGEVAEKGFFANLLWRNDSSKTFNVETQKSILTGTEATVTARRANGETTVLGNDGVWHLLKR